MKYVYVIIAFLIIAHDLESSEATQRPKTLPSIPGAAIPLSLQRLLHGSKFEKPVLQKIENSESVMNERKGIQGLIGEEFLTRHRWNLSELEAFAKLIKSANNEVKAIKMQFVEKIPAYVQEMITQNLSTLVQVQADEVAQIKEQLRLRVEKRLQEHHLSDKQVSKVMDYFSFEFDAAIPHKSPKRVVFVTDY